MASCRTRRTIPNHLSGAFLWASLLASALQCRTASADTGVGPPVAEMRYAHYTERQEDGGERMTVSSPLFYTRAPLTDSLEIEGSFLLDSVSGASPYYLDTLSGASGMGVHDDRTAGDLALTSYFERFSLSVIGALSNEDDYDALALGIRSDIWSEDRNTTVTVGIGAGEDDITSTLAPTLDESRRTADIIIGVTQLLDPVSYVQSNLTWKNSDGFMSDPYKSFDKRPRSRDEIAWLTRYRRFIEATDGALHLDYRLFHDSWGITSHTFEFAFLQPLGENWIIRPMLRYYSQGSADFFQDQVPPPEDFNGFFTADQRLGDLGSVSLGLGITRDLGSGFSIDGSAYFIEQRSDWKLGGGGSEAVQPLNARVLTLGLTKTF